MAKAPTRILVVDDHPVVRLGVRQMITADPTLTVCAEADTGEAALDIVADRAVDLAIVDLSLKELSGLELIRRLRERHPDLPILVLSIHDEALFAERAIRAGARGYIMKEAAIVGLLDAIRQVLSGRIYVSERVAQQVLMGIGHVGGWNGERLGGLTDRELQVFEMIGHGASTAAIAERLSISVKTVETYRVNIKSKLDLKDATALVRYATTWVEHL